VSERLVFGYGTSGHGGATPPRADVRPEPAQVVTEPVGPKKPAARDREERRDWAFVGLLTFTAVLFFRPQDSIPALAVLHLAELAALGALVAMVMGRLGRGASVTRFTPELAGVVALGAIILFTAPFSIWMGGAVGTFTDVYVKVILIFLLMVNTLTSPRRVDQFMWLIVLAMGYLAFRAMFDYARGINLIENGRVQGAVGGMFRNPNDLALNMVAVMPLAAALALRARTAFGKLSASGCAVAMMAAVVVSQSRSGSIGLVVMALFLGGYLLRRRPGVAFAAVLAIVLALPLMPVSYWNRISSITDESLDETGSREARHILLRESFAAFLQHPLTGVGAGQFKNYDPQGRQQAWRESHNVMLQVAAELGVFGLFTFMFLVVRGAMAGSQVRRLLRRAGHGQPRRRRTAALPADPAVTDSEAEWLQTHTAVMSAALAGWFFCALFSSVAYNWTFYYLLALAIAPREILMDRLARARKPRTVAGGVPVRMQEARA
jgi:putative inorganic carbon (HCO3(-)) transporter